MRQQVLRGVLCHECAQGPQRELSHARLAALALFEQEKASEKQVRSKSEEEKRREEKKTDSPGRPGSAKT